MDIARQLCGDALRAMTGLRNMTWQEIDRTSQGMIDGCANYAGDKQIEARCHDCTASIDRHIDEMAEVLRDCPDASLLSVQLAAGMSMEQIKANIKLAISGGQNEPRDVIAGIVWALLTHPEQLALVLSGEATWMQAFEEYTRWQSPIGMSPRQMARDYELHGATLNTGDRVFLMFGSGNRDEANFDRPELFRCGTRCVRIHSFRGGSPLLCRRMGVEMSYRRSRIATIVRNSTKFTPERPDRNRWLGIPWANDNTGRLGY